MHLRLLGLATVLIAATVGAIPTPLHRGPHAHPTATPYRFPQLAIAQGPVQVANVLIVPQAVITPTPSPTPTATPTPPPSGCLPSYYTNIVNGAQPPNNFCPYTTAAGVNVVLPENPQNTDPSKTATLQGSNYLGNGTLFYPNKSDGNDFSHPVYLAANSDPSVNTHCVAYTFGCNTAFPATIHVPARARQATGSDHHFGVIQPNGDEYDFWTTHCRLADDVTSCDGSDWVSGDYIESGEAAKTNITTGSGYPVPVGGATDGGALMAMQIYFHEINAGTIPHALFLVSACDKTGFIFPANSDGVPCAGGAGLPMGTHVHLRLNDSQIAALPNSVAGPAEKIILSALHHYGGYLSDTGCAVSSTPTPFCIMFESPTPYIAYGNTPPGTAFAAANGWSCSSTCVSPVGINWAAIGAANWDVVKGCYTDGSCTL